jgi:hypothetical protein
MGQGAVLLPELALHSAVELLELSPACMSLFEKGRVVLTFELVGIDRHYIPTKMFGRSLVINGNPSSCNCRAAC